MRRYGACIRATVCNYRDAFFCPGLERLEQRIIDRVLDDVSRDIPSEWYGDGYEDLLELLEQLFRRRTRVPELLLEAKKSSRQPFPNWV